MTDPSVAIAVGAIMSVIGIALIAIIYGAFIEHGTPPDDDYETGERE